MVEWDGGFDTLIRVREQENEGNTLGSLFVFFFGGGKKRGGFLLQNGWFKFTSCRSEKFFFGTKDFGWFFVESC